MAKLKAPQSWWDLPEENRNNRINAAPCGPGKGVLAQIVPDDIWGLDIRPA